MIKLTDIYNTIKEEMSDDEIINSLKSQLAKVGIDKARPGVFKVIDKRKDTPKPNVITYMSVDDSGEIKPEDNIEEGLKDKIMAGVVCTILATGMVSCTKEDTAGFGYNVASRSTEYTLGKGTPNKTVTISTPMGDEEHEVDSTMGDTKFYGGSQGLKFSRPMTPTEALIIKIGHAYQSEKNMNNKKGTPANKRWDYNPDNAEITGKGTMYQDNKTPFNDARQHPLWLLGIEAARNAGKDIQALMQKADQELQDQNWVNEGFKRMQKLAGIITESQYKEKLNETTYIGSDGELSGDFTLNQLPLNQNVKQYINKIIKDAKDDGEFENLKSFGYFDTELPIHLLQKFNGAIIEDLLDISPEDLEYLTSELDDLEDPEGLEDLDIDDEIKDKLYTSISDNVMNYIQSNVNYDLN
jgi:hypothetical protein